MSVESKVEELQKSVEAATMSIADLRFSSKYSLHLLTVLLVARCYELAYSILALTKSKSDVGIPVLLRSLLEHTVRLAYIVLDPVINPLSLELEDNVKRLKALKSMQDLGCQKKRTGEIDKLEKQIDKLKGQKVKSHTFRKKLELIAKNPKLMGYLEPNKMYLSFGMLSNISHGQVASLAYHGLAGKETENNVSLLKPMDSELKGEFIAKSTQLLNAAIQYAIKIIKDAPGGETKNS